MERYDFKKILYTLNIGSEEFWLFLHGKVKYLPLQVNDFGWGCFPITDNEDRLIDIRILVPKIVDQQTLLVNIHEFAHAFELYNKLGTIYVENVEKSENFARLKEAEYLRLVKK